MLKRCITVGWPREGQVGEEFKSYFKVKEMSVEGVFLMRGSLLIPPASLRSRLIALAHKRHIGMTGTKKKLRLYYWWPGMDGSVDTMLGNCSECGHAEKSLRTYNTPLSPITFLQQPWEKLGMDFVGPMGV